MTQHEKKKADPSQDDLEHEAVRITQVIADLDAQIKTLSTQRAAKHKELRAITSKIVTLKLKSQ